MEHESVEKDFRYVVEDGLITRFDECQVEGYAIRLDEEESIEHKEVRFVGEDDFGRTEVEFDSDKLKVFGTTTEAARWWVASGYTFTSTYKPTIIEVRTVEVIKEERAPGAEV